MIHWVNIFAVVSCITDITDAPEPVLAFGVLRIWIGHMEAVVRSRGGVGCPPSLVALGTRDSY